MKTTVTLKDLVSAVSEYAESDNEVIATVLHMVESGQVHLETELNGTPGFETPIVPDYQLPS